MPPYRKQGKNPANSQSELFKALTKLFSGPLVSYRSQSGRRLRRQHLDKFSSRFKSASGQQFKKSIHSPLNNLATEAIANQRRTERYVDFDQMEYEPIIASAIDIYADEMTTHSDLRSMLNIKCPNEEIKAVLTVLYEQVLNVQYNLFGWSRTMCKYGDFFLYLDIDDKYGIKSVIALPPVEIERLEGKDTTNPNYVQYQWNTAGMTFENWQVCHFRVLGNDKYSPYGTSVLEPARRIWRQLTLMEDAMMAYRIVRSSERRVFKIDVGAIPPQDVEQYMHKITSQLKRHTVVDPSNGRVDLRYNPMSIEEDYFIPVRQGSATDIQNLAGGQNTTQIDDIKYLRDKLFAAIKVPQSYLVMGEDAAEDKATLAQKDIRFARTIQRLQRVIISELTKIGIIHLYTLGFRGEDLLAFSLHLNNPAKIAELQEIEHWKAKFDIAASATEGFFSRRWVSEHIFGMSHDEFTRNQREIYFDRKQDSTLQAVAEASAVAGSGGLGGEDFADDGFGNAEAPFGPEEFGPEEMPAGEADISTPPEEPESSLLAIPPGSRPTSRIAPENKEGHLTPGAKGKRYSFKKTDRKKSGARSRSLSRQAGKMLPSDILPGAKELSTIGSGIFNEQQSSYNSREQVEEDRLFEVNNSIRELINDLRDNDNKLKETEINEN